tara:strand:- start:11198 stop:11695 length:498 start_codon:yes stop_codon:yes gene_type:complete
MKKISELTVTEFQTLLKEFYAPETERTKMTVEEIQELAEKINEKINIPFIRERKDEKIYFKIVLTIDDFLYNNLPGELYDLIRSLEEGISDEEAKNLITRLPKLANKNIDIPYIPEKFEFMAFHFIIGIIINAARDAFYFKTAIASMMNTQLPEIEEFDAQLLLA